MNYQRLPGYDPILSTSWCDPGFGKTKDTTWAVTTQLGIVMQAMTPGSWNLNQSGFYDHVSLFHIAQNGNFSHQDQPPTSTTSTLHPWKLTGNLKIIQLKKNTIFPKHQFSGALIGVPNSHGFPRDRWRSEGVWKTTRRAHPKNNYKWSYYNPYKWHQKMGFTGIISPYL